MTQKQKQTRRRNRSHQLHRGMGRGVRVQRSATNLKNPLLVELHIWWSFSWSAEDSSSMFPVSLSFLRPSLTLRLTLYSIYDLWPICPRTRGTTQHFRTPPPSCNVERISAEEVWMQLFTVLNPDVSRGLCAVISISLCSSLIINPNLQIITLIPTPILDL